MGLAIARQDLALRIYKRLSVVNALAGTLGNTGDNGERKCFRHLLQGGNGPFRPRLRQLANDGHRITRVRCLGKNDQLDAFVFRPRAELPHLRDIGGDIPERAGDLSGSNFHLDPRMDANLRE